MDNHSTPIRELIARGMNHNVQFLLPIIKPISRRNESQRSVFASYYKTNTLKVYTQLLTP